MFSVVLQNGVSTRRYSVSAHADVGWQVIVEREGERPQLLCYHDWHRVERTVAIWRREVSDLTARGWHVTESADRCGN